MVELRYAHAYFFGKGNVKGHLERPDVDRSLQLKLILKIYLYIFKVWTGSYGSGQMLMEIFYEYGNENSGSILTEWNYLREDSD
jgi:hypothetical protein